MFPFWLPSLIGIRFWFSIYFALPEPAVFCAGGGAVGLGALGGGFTPVRSTRLPPLVLY